MKRYLMYNDNQGMASSGVRKGAWTKEEDELLKKCIEKYGEKNWHLTPLRAGLNRCRKSCRLRWLNYLNPTINRSPFSSEEVDLIIRLHKLLGNRWSLIAGRIPGRTANDIKNYWNTHLAKKINSSPKQDNGTTETVAKINVIRPRPYAPSRKLSFSGSKNCMSGTSAEQNRSTEPSPKNDILNVDNLLNDGGADIGPTFNLTHYSCLEPLTCNILTQETHMNKFGEDGVHDDDNFLGDFFLDGNIWDDFISV